MTDERRSQEHTQPRRLSGYRPGGIPSSGDTSARAEAERGAEGQGGVDRGGLFRVWLRRADARGREGFPELRLSQLETTLAALRAASRRCDVRLQGPFADGSDEPDAASDGEDELSVDGVGPELCRGERRGYSAGSFDWTFARGDGGASPGDGREDRDL